MLEELQPHQNSYDEAREQAEADIHATLGDRAADLQHLSVEEVLSWQEDSEPVEVPYDPARLETIAADDTNDNLVDVHKDGVAHAPDSALTGGDIDANHDDAATVGDEAVGGTVATPDQDIVDEVAAASGLELDDRTDVRMTAILEERDDRRWELDPKSSEDYSHRRD